MSKTKKDKLKITLAIIVKNERKSSETIFPNIPKSSVDQIFVIDGNSTDGTREYFTSRHIPVFTQKKPGLGAATFEARKHTTTDAIIFFHPDGNEEPKDIAKIAEYLRIGYELVIPSRMIKGGYNEEDDSLIKPRKWFNIMLAFIINILWHRKRPFISEIVQGFRGIRVDTFDKLKLDTNDRTIDLQMVIRSLKYDVNFYEFPTREGKRISGDTHFQSLPTGYKNLRTFAREIFDPSTYPSGS